MARGMWHTLAIGDKDAQHTVLLGFGVPHGLNGWDGAFGGHVLLDSVEIDRWHGAAHFGLYVAL